MVYAPDTKVSVEASRAEIERTLKRYKAEAFFFAEELPKTMIAFRINGRMIKFTLTMPDRNSKAFTHYMRGFTEVRREPGPAQEKWDQACRQKWRALALVIKAKLEAVDAGITTIEDEFLANTVMPDGSTVGERAQAELALAYQTGEMPRFLLGAPGGSSHG